MFSKTPINLNYCEQEDILAYFANAWNLQDRLFSSILAESSFFLTPDPLRNPLIFYLGHPAAFYINILIEVGLVKNRVRPDYEDLFARGVDPESPEELEESLQGITWPTVQSVWEYRNQCFHAVMDAIRSLTIDFPITSNSPVWALLMGIEHDRIHFETTSMLIRQLPSHLVEIPGEWQYAPSNGSPPENELVFVEQGSVSLGKPNSSAFYGWDNEYGHLEVEVQPFWVSKFLISNKEFLTFVEEGGYQDRKYWTDETWGWKEKSLTTHPKFWLPRGRSFAYRAVFDEMNMPWDFPVEVNHNEAMAYCRWKGANTRLLSEAEWNHILNQEESRSLADLNFDSYNLDFKFCSPTPVQTQCGKKTGIYDVRGNVWCWLADTFYPLPGFQYHPLYPDFSAPFFTEKHSMMVGGSWATTGTAASRFYRLWFRQHFYQHAGFRIAQA